MHGFHLVLSVLLLSCHAAAASSSPLPALPESFSATERMLLAAKIAEVPTSCSCAVDEAQPLYPSCSLDAGGTMCVPRVIHQTWKAKEPPAELASLHASWRRLHPEWLVLLWSDADAAAWIARAFPANVSAAFAALAAPVQRADLFRYLVLAAYGGVYADVDLECLRPLDAYVARIQHPLAFLGPGAWWSSISNALIVSRRCPALWAPLLAHCLAAVAAMRASAWRALPHARVMSSTGPTMLRLYLETRAPRALCRLPRALFSPCDYCDHACAPAAAVLTRHHYARSWNAWDTALLNVVQCHPATALLLLLLALATLTALLCRRRPHKVRRHTV